MTVEELKQYRVILKEMADLEKRINRICEKETDVVPGTVKASMRRFPYIETRMDIWMNDPEQEEKLDRQLAMYQAQLFNAERRIDVIEEFIEAIPDTEIRLIFRYRFIDGKKLWEIAELVDMDRSGIGKKIKDYLKFPPIPQNL